MTNEKMPNDESFGVWKLGFGIYNAFGVQVSRVIAASSDAEESPLSIERDAG